jgi:hypothetical protein
MIRESVEEPHRKRESMRRGVQMPVGIGSSYWDGSVPLVATDVSGSGLFIECTLPLHEGERVALRFVPPGLALPFELEGEVRRAVLARRRSDGGRSGMGIAFRSMTASSREILEFILTGVPPRLPRATDERTAQLPQDDGGMVGA